MAAGCTLPVEVTSQWHPGPSVTCGTVPGSPGGYVYLIVGCMGTGDDLQCISTNIGPCRCRRHVCTHSASTDSYFSSSPSSACCWVFQLLPLLPQRSLLPCKSYNSSFPKPVWLPHRVVPFLCCLLCCGGRGLAFACHVSGPIKYCILLLRLPADVCCVALLPAGCVSAAVGVAHAADTPLIRRTSPPRQSCATFLAAASHACGWGVFQFKVPLHLGHPCSEEWALLLPHGRRSLQCCLEPGSWVAPCSCCSAGAVAACCALAYDVCRGCVKCVSRRSVRFHVWVRWSWCLGEGQNCSTGIHGCVDHAERVTAGGVYCSCCCVVSISQPRWLLLYVRR
jgi:hypothetical protein